MEIEVGKTAYLDGWDTENGTYVKECIVVAIDEGQVKLRVLRTFFPDGRSLSADGEELVVDKKYLEIPLKGRVRNQNDDIQWFIDQFKKG